jgi:hypothetical protein
MHLNAGEVLSKTPLRQLAGRAYQVAKIDFLVSECKQRGIF